MHKLSYEKNISFFIYIMTLTSTDILLIINTILTALNPFLTSLAYFVKHISSSTCWGSSVILRKPTNPKINTEV